MLDNSTNQTQDHMNADPQQTFNAADSVVKEPKKSWSLSTLERSLLFGVWFLAFFLAFRAGRSIMEWQFGLTIVLAVVMTIVIPILSRENKCVTSELNDKPGAFSFKQILGLSKFLDPLFQVRRGSKPRLPGLGGPKSG